MTLGKGGQSGVLGEVPGMVGGGLDLKTQAFTRVVISFVFVFAVGPLFT